MPSVSGEAKVGNKFIWCITYNIPKSIASHQGGPSTSRHLILMFSMSQVCVILGRFSSENKKGFTRVKWGEEWYDTPKSIASGQGGPSRPLMFSMSQGRSRGDSRPVLSHFLLTFLPLTLTLTATSTPPWMVPLALKPQESYVKLTCSPDRLIWILCCNSSRSSTPWRQHTYYWRNSMDQSL